MATEIRIFGLPELFQKLGAAQAITVLDRPMHRAVAQIHNWIAVYPAPPPGSRYRRTGTLGRRWTTRVRRAAGGVEGRVGNVTHYAPFVQSAMFQARIHRGRWRTDEGAIRSLLPAITADFQRQVDRALAGR